MKAKRFLIPILAVWMLFSGCASQPGAAESGSSGISSEAQTEPSESSEAQQPSASEAQVRTITDSLGNTAEIPENPRVVSLYASFAQCWLLSGGSLVGVTEDATEERGIETGGDIALVGTVKEPSLEQIAALSPDYVLLSADLSAHMDLDQSLTDMQIPHGYFQMDTFEDYSRIMASFCALNDSAGTRYEACVTALQENIESTIAETTAAFSEEAPRILLLRAYSTGVKAKTSDNLTGIMLDELGAYNIAYDNPSLLEDLSAEEIIVQDPDFIFVTTMGSEESAKAYMQENIESNPAWSELTAVKNGRYIYLPKDLFHYKPLNRWDESYAYLADCLLGKSE